ncbi:MAG: hypothetical protein J6T51_08175 [Kiritimatiellae bacterium]|nr:hypothetical protein [Kiritimatiellia bacterium]
MNKIVKTLVAAVAAATALPMAALADTYAYKVEYLQSSGAQYIDTGIVPTSNTMVRVKYEYLGANGSYDMIAGCTSQRYYPVSLNTKDPQKERHVYNGTSFNDNQTALTVHTVVFNDAQHRVYKDDRLVTTFDQTFSTTRNCFLFASNNTGSPNYYSTARIYWFEFVDTSTDEVLRRFIPVVDNEGRPAMFDEIEETLYYNLGSGDDFIAGPREGAEKMWYLVEYLESNGNQYIDTGVFATSKVETVVGYKFTDETQPSLAMICGSQSNSKYYPVSLNSTSGMDERYAFDSKTIKQMHAALQHHEIDFNDGGGNVFVDGKYLDTISSATISGFKAATAPIYLFATSQTGSNAAYKSKSRIYHCEIYNNGAPQREFMPAVALDGNGTYSPCMHDRVFVTNCFNKGTGAFAVGRIISPEVPLKLAARGITPSDGLKVLEFTERPSYGTVFTVDDAYANDFDVEVRSDGVYTVAKGTGGDAANVITVTGNTARQFPVDNMPVCASVVLSGTITLTGDCDWTGLGKVVLPDGVTIDLNGNDLSLAGFAVLPGSVVKITDATADGGSLIVTVAENDVLLNSNVRFEGSMKFVKKGAGTFIAEMTDQAYSGGTDIAEGVLRMGDKNLNNGYNAELGPVSSTVRIGDGATLDTLGVTGQEFVYVISNGTLSASRANKNSYRQNGDVVTLDGDATMTGVHFGLIVGSNLPFIMNMNGNTLYVNLNTGEEFSICNATFAGEGVLEGLSGWIKPYVHPCVGTNLTLRFPLNTGGLYLDKNMTVSNFVSHTGNFDKGATDTALTVLGTFTPAEDGRTKFPNMVLADGSTIDLSEMGDEPTLPTTCVCKNTPRKMSFADNATIKVKLGNRHVSCDVPIVGWETPPENLAGIKFVMGDSDRKYALSKRSDGLYVVKGFMLIYR